MNLISSPAVAGTYLRVLYSAPVEAREAVQRFTDMPEHDVVMALLYLAQRVPAAFASSMATLPCVAGGCDHVRHEGTCLAAMIDADGHERLCDCDTMPTQPIAYELTQDQELRAIVHADRADWT